MIFLMAYLRMRIISIAVWYNEKILSKKREKAKYFLTRKKKRLTMRSNNLNKRKMD